MVNNLLLWFVELGRQVKDGASYLFSRPFYGVGGLPPAIQNLSVISLITISGLIVFIGVAVIKWILS